MRLTQTSKIAQIWNAGYFGSVEKLSYRPFEENRILANNRGKISANVSRLLTQGKYDKAIMELQKLVEEEPTDYRTLLRMAETYAKMGRPLDAIQTYENVATQYTAEGFHMKAIAVYKQMLRVDNNMTDVHKALAEQYQALGMQKDSLHHYDTVAGLFEQGGRLQEALGIYRRMVEQQPDDIKTRVRLADYLSKQQMTTDAVREYQVAAELAQKATLTEEYIQIVEKQLLVEPRNVERNRSLGRLYLQRGDPQKALVKIQQCFSLAPKDLETLPLVAEVFDSLGQKNKAAAVQKEMGRLYIESGEQQKANTAWREVLKVIPEDQEAKKALQEGGLSEATITPEGIHLIGVEPELTELLKDIDVFLSYGLKPKAIAHLNDALQIAPSDLDLHTRLVDLLKETDDSKAYLDAAQKRLELAQNTNDPRVKEWQIELTQGDIPDYETLELDISFEANETQEASTVEELQSTSEMDLIQISVAEVLAQFKQGVQENVQEEDADTHFELGIAYKEMGLFNEAKESFAVAARTPSKEVDAKHLTALILMEEGDSHEALTLFEEILKKPNLNSSQKGANYFQKGLCHQRLSQKEEAFGAFQAASATGEALPGLLERLEIVSKNR